jgi:probable phosphoglycerate mutase
VKIIAVRHGEVALNAEGKLSGWLDGPLNELGHRQAAEVGQQLGGRSFRVIAASPLLRTRQTAELISEQMGAVRKRALCGDKVEMHCPIHLFSDLRERNFGELNGKTWEEAEAYAGRPLRLIDTIELKYDYRPWGGECVADVEARVRHFLSCAQSYAAGADELLVVTHGGVIRMFYELIGTKPRPSITNCSVHEFELGLKV